MNLRRLVSAAALLATVAFSTPSPAQTEADKADAEAAFDLGKQLLEAGKFTEACPKFAESVRLDPGIGSLLYLADCHEKTGLTASAWAEFREAEALAKRSNDPRERVAHDRAALLEPKLSKLKIVVESAVASTPGLEVRRDDGLVGRPLWGSPIPVDPGEHRVSASAPGKETWTATVTVGANAAQSETHVPALVDAPVVAGAPPGAGAAASPRASTSPGDTGDPNKGRTQRLIGLGVAGVGVIGLGLGTYFGLHAKSQLDDSNADGHCHDGNVCDGQGSQLRSDALSSATISTVAFSLGAVALAGGIVLYLTAPHHASPTLAVTSSALPGGASVGLHGAF